MKKHIFITGILTLGITACQLSPPPNTVVKRKIEMASSLTPETKGVTSELPHLTPETKGILSGKVLLPSGILLPSGFTTQATHDEFQQAGRGFSVVALDQAGNAYGPANTDETGWFQIKEIPLGQRLKIQATFKANTKMVLKAFVDAPKNQEHSEVTKNVTIETTAITSIIDIQERETGFTIPLEKFSTSEELEILTSRVTQKMKEVVQKWAEIDRAMEDMQPIKEELTKVRSELNNLTQRQPEITVPTPSPIPSVQTSVPSNIRPSEAPFTLIPPSPTPKPEPTSIPTPSKLFRIEASDPQVNVTGNWLVNGSDRNTDGSTVLDATTERWQDYNTQLKYQGNWADYSDNTAIGGTFKATGGQTFFSDSLALNFVGTWVETSEVDTMNGKYKATAGKQYQENNSKLNYLGTWNDYPSELAMGGNVKATLGLTIDDANPSITYNGTWVELTDSNVIGGTFKYSNTAGGYAALSFTGTKLEWYATKGNNRGIAEVTIDNGEPIIVDLYASTYQRRQKVFERTDLTPGQHTVRIMVTGTKNNNATDTYVDIDALIPSGMNHPAVEMTFYGTGVKWYGNKSKYRSYANVSIDGGTATEVNLFDFSTGPKRELYTSPNLPNSSHTIRIEWSEKIHSSALSNAIDVDALVVTGSENPYVEIPFTGTRVDWYGSKSQWRGYANVSVDGGSVTEVNLFDWSLGYKKLLYTQDGLSPGNHTLKIEWAGKKVDSAFSTTIDVDAIVTYSPNAHYVEIPFDGTGIKWYGSKSKWRGYAKVSLDGGTPEELNLFDWSLGRGRLLYSKEGLLPGNHNLKIEWAGKKVDSAFSTTIDVEAIDILKDLRPTAKLTIKGTEFTVIGVKGPDKGKVLVRMDGSPGILVDLYSAIRQENQRLHTFSTLPFNEHTLEVLATGFKNDASSGHDIHLDAFEVRE